MKARASISPVARWRSSNGQPRSFEAAGGRVFEESREALAPFGRLVVYGISTREQNTVKTGGLMRRSQAVVGFWLFGLLDRPGKIDEALADLFDHASRGDLRVVVGGTYALSDAARAQEDLLARRTRGKLALDPSR